ncbi:MAG: chemotaxis protein CheW [Candidatus Marinimicrobia bacterium]|nr:chemotaxis protein CheW [Candidatus Neomarinimicrobiota bacterium]
MSFDMGDEILQTFLEEAEEHLDGIEQDLLEIEEMGENIDDELVNRVFRSAHSVKGGSGFLGLDTIKDLSHSIENILDMVRNKELVPTSSVVSKVLDAFDRLKELIANASESNDMEIAPWVEKLEKITKENLEEGEKDSIDENIVVVAPDGRISFDVTKFDYNHARKGNNILYVLEYDLIHDVQRQDKTPLDVITLLDDIGVIVDIIVGVAQVGSLDDEPTDITLPMFVLFSTIVEDDLIGSVTRLSDKQIQVIPEDYREPDTHGMEKKTLPEEKTKPVAEETVPESRPQVKPTTPAKKVSRSKKMQTETVGSNSSDDKASLKKSDTLRVKVTVLDQLMNKAAQLVLARNQLIQAREVDNRRKLDVATKEIDRVSSELQDAIMLTRMQPVNTVFSKLPRVIRDLAQDLGKEIELVMEGKEVELDKTMLEGLGDPLLHIVRNSADHGIETPDIREQLGKPRQGTILLKAYHESGLVNIEIVDDGKGIDPDKIAMSALQKGLYTEREIEAMSDEEKINMIMLPGFSTAEKITDVSGRGVGMDVVRSNIDKMGGTVQIKSVKDVGSTMNIRLPLTLAIISSLLIKASGQRYAVPQVNVSEVLTIARKDLEDRVKKIGDADVLILRGELVPLIQLNELLEMQMTFVNPKTGKEEIDRRKNIVDERLIEDENEFVKETQKSKLSKKIKERRQDETNTRINIIIVNSGVFKYGLVVDELQDNVEIVVKPLGVHLKKFREYAGATILGDGTVALILDISGLANKAELHTLSGTKNQKNIISKKEKQQNLKESVNKTMLLFRNAPEERCALPLSKVTRLEKIKASDIEIVGGKKVVQYRGGSLPVYALEEATSVGMLEDTEDLIVIVFNVKGNEVGLLTVPPVDAENLDLMIDERNAHMTGVDGTAIINDHTVLIINVDEIMRVLNPQWYNEVEEEYGSEEYRPKSSKSGKMQSQIVEEIIEEIEEVEDKRGTKPALKSSGGSKILIVEDSSFFLAQISKLMQDEGFQVVEAMDGKEAWDKLNSFKNEIVMVVTDLEMPVMDGFELTKKIKASKEFGQMPVVALTSLAEESQVEKGKKAGIDDYQIKLDKVKLLQSIKKYYQKALNLN